MHFSFWSTHSPHNALMQLRNFEVEEFLKVEKGDVVKAFSHMINTARIIGVDDFNRLALTFLSVGAVELCHAEAFRNFRAFDGSISINSHGADVDEMALSVELHDGNEDIFSGESVVSVGVIDCFD